MTVQLDLTNHVAKSEVKPATCVGASGFTKT